MKLNRGQWLELNVAHAVAVRTTFLVEALLGLYAQNADEHRAELEPILGKLAEYRQIADELDQRFALGGDPHDIRPLIVDQIYRTRDALNVRLTDELTNFGPLESADERFLRQRLATLSFLVDEIARSVYRLPPRTI